MKRKIMVIVLAVICSLALAIGLTACSNRNDNPPTAHTHNYIQEYDETNHWMECSVADCTEKIKDRTTHVFDDDADETCNVCKYKRCIHDWSDWTVGESNHARTCKKCGITQSEMHDYVEYFSGSACNAVGAYIFAFCKTCGDIRTSEAVLHPHDYEILSHVEATCTDCGISEWVRCKNCGYEPLKHYTAPLGHSPYGNYYSYSNTYHYRNCSRCNGKVLSLHRFGSITIIKHATCTTSGLTSRKCLDCGYTQETVIPPYHNKKYGEPILEPTCTEKGSRPWTCSRCGETGTESIPALGHDKRYGEPTLEPTCTEKGSRPWTCSHCGLTGTESIPALDHDWEIKVIKHSTCTEYGELKKTCKRCGKTINERIPPEHNFDNGTKIEDATCTESGKILYYCNLCDYSEIRDIPPLGHDYSETITLPTCTTGGYAAKVCSRCGDVIEEKYSDSLGHSLEWKYDESVHWQVCKRSGCDYVTECAAHETGIHVFTERTNGTYLHKLVLSCECGYVEKELSVIHEHEGVELQYDPKPTCTESGFVRLVCNVSGCDFVYDAMDLPALGHNFDFQGSDCQCTRCDVWYFDIYHTEGLEYELNDDGQSYTCTGIGTTNDTNIVIARTYYGLPVTNIGYDAFSFCSSLISITIPNSVTNIASFAFIGCSNLMSITIPNSVTSIGDGALAGCIKYIIYCEATIMPSDWVNNLNTNGRPVVWDCKNNDKDENGYAYATIDGIRYSLKDGAATVIEQPSNITTANIPVSVIYKEQSYSVTSIGDEAFDGCSGLTSITIPNSVTSIGSEAFRGCDSLQYNEYDNAYYLGNNTNKYVALIKAKDESITSCTIHENTKLIYESAFSGCSKLTSITIPFVGASKDGTGSTYFGFIFGTGGDYVPLSLKTVIITGGTSIGSSAFYGCSGLTSITIPNSVTSIGSSAFYGCSGLTSITIPNSVTSIGDYAFDGCSGLTSITIPNSVTSIGSSAFYGCSGLTSITIPNSVTSIGSSAFYGCSGLTSITIPNNIMSIGYRAFYGCSGLTSITIGSRVTSIGREAFHGCSMLTSITIPNNVTSIGYRAFYGCSGLTSITFNGTKAEWSVISKDLDLDISTGNYIVICTDGKLDKDGNEIVE